MSQTNPERMKLIAEFTAELIVAVERRSEARDRGTELNSYFELIARDRGLDLSAATRDRST
jgi:hypothetical protein